MNLANLIIALQDAETEEEKDALRKKYNESVNKKNKEHLDWLKNVLLIKNL